MVVPFGFSVGDFVVITKLIYKISVELKNNPESATDYQLLLIELEALDRTLQSLPHIKVAPQGQKRLDGICALALACELPLQEFLAKIEEFDDSLGSWNTSNRSISGIAKRLRWSAKYKDEARVLRERLSPNLATISILLMAQTVDSISQGEPLVTTSIRGMTDSMASQSRNLTELQSSARGVENTQHRLVTGQAHLISVVANHDECLETLTTQASQILENSNAHGAQLHHHSRILEDLDENITDIKSSADKSYTLASSINRGVAEIKATIPSILTRTLDL